MLTNAIAQYKAEGKAIELENAEHDLRKLDEAKATGLKYKDTEGNVYEVFSWYYIAETGGKRWQHSYMYNTKWGVQTGTTRKNRCFK